MYTTAKAWKFTPSLPCCVPDTIDLNFITTQCTTVTSNRWRPVITDSLGRASTTACDTISYLYVDSLVSDYLQNINGGSNEILFYNTAGKISSDAKLTFNNLLEQFIITKEQSQINTEFNCNLDNGTLSYTVQDTFNKILSNFIFSITNGNRIKYDRFQDTLSYFIQEDYLQEGAIKIGTVKELNSGAQVKVKALGFDTLGVFFCKAVNSQIETNEKYYFPTDTGSVGQSLIVATNDGNGNTTLEWGNQILTDTATLNFGSIANNSYEDLTVTVAGATTGDVVSFGTPTAAAVTYATFTAWVSATDTVTIRCVNVHSSSINPASGLFKVKVFKD
jgi:hypothetical protein